MLISLSTSSLYVCNVCGGDDSCGGCHITVMALIHFLSSSTDSTCVTI